MTTALASVPDWYVPPIAAVQTLQPEPPRINNAVPRATPDPLDEAFVEQTLGAPLVVYHEAAHAVCGHLLGLHVNEVQIRTGGSGFVMLGHDRNSAADVARLGVTCAIAPILHEKLRAGFETCGGDMGNVILSEGDYERLTNGSLYATWAGARLVLDHPSFRAGMNRMVPLLEERRVLTAVEVQAALAGLPLIALPDLPPPVPLMLPAPAATVQDHAGDYSI